MNSVFQPYEKTKVLVTGATGFIGRWVCRFLTRAGAQIHVAVRRTETYRKVAREYEIRAHVIEMDLTDYSGVKKMVANLAPRILFNLAAYGIDREETNEAAAFAINDELVEHLALAMTGSEPGKWRGAGMVHVGSAAEYGSNENVIRENTPPHPASLYGKSKLAGFNRLSRVCREKGLRAVTLRPFTVYGPGEHSHRLLPSLIFAAQSEKELDLSAGFQKRDFVYVEDVAEGILRAGLLSQGTGHAWFNLATGRLTAVREFVLTAARILPLKESQLCFGKIKTIPNDLDQGPVDPEKLQGALGWKPQTGIAEGIRKTVSFFESRQSKGF